MSRVLDTGDRITGAAPKGSAYKFEPSFIREQLAERLEQELQDAEDWDQAARIGSGDDDWIGSVNE